MKIFFFSIVITVGNSLFLFRFLSLFLSYLPKINFPRLIDESGDQKEMKERCNARKRSRGKLYKRMKILWFFAPPPHTRRSRPECSSLGTLRCSICHMASALWCPDMPSRPPSLPPSPVVMPLDVSLSRRFALRRSCFLGACIHTIPFSCRYALE